MAMHRRMLVGSSGVARAAKSVCSGREPRWRPRATPDWVSPALMSMLAPSLLIDASCRLVRYRRG